jgi:ABC-type hemin transport system substrate-binding protein
MEHPQRIMSLVPSLTELVWWLGGGERLVGRTRFCVEPAGQIERVPAFGGTKDPDVAAIVTLEPDLVIANREENRKEDVEALRGAGLNVLLTDPGTVLEAAATIRGLGEAIGAQGAAAVLANELSRLASDVPEARVRVFVPIWRKPLMGLGSDTFGDDMLRCAGAVNVLAGKDRYPEVCMEEVAALGADLVLLPDEPFRFTERHIPEFSGIAPARVIDGQLLFWYGPRTGDAIRRLRALLGSER